LDAGPDDFFGFFFVFLCDLKLGDSAYFIHLERREPGLGAGQIILLLLQLNKELFVGDV
jgi:hypothetical protein